MRRPWRGSFRQWVAGLIPALEAGTVVAVDGKTSRRSGGEGRGPLHLVSALATGIGVVLGQEATSEKSNELTAIPPLLQMLADTRGYRHHRCHGHPCLPIAKVIQEQGADYVLAVKDNQPYLAESMREFFATGQAMSGAGVAYDYYETAEKDHGRIEVRRCYYAFGQLACLANPEQWPGVTDVRGGALRAHDQGQDQPGGAALHRQHPRAGQALCTRGACPLGGR